GGNGAGLGMWRRRPQGLWNQPGLVEQLVAFEHALVAPAAGLEAEGEAHALAAPRPLGAPRRRRHPTPEQLFDLAVENCGLAAARSLSACRSAPAAPPAPPAPAAPPR